jgi:hypothetical protein
MLALLCTVAVPTESQRPAQPPAPPAPQPETQPPAPQQPTPAATPAPETPAQPQSQPSKPTGSSGEVTEESLKRELVGKPLFLRGGYLGDNLSFNEHGLPTGHPTVGSYTLSGIQIDKVHLTKHKVELEGSRYGLHFLGALPYEDPDKAVDRVKITPKKKVLRISIRLRPSPATRPLRPPPPSPPLKPT